MSQAKLLLNMYMGYKWTNQRLNEKYVLFFLYIIHLAHLWCVYIYT